MLGIIYRDGKGVDVDLSKAEYYFKLSANNNCAEALFNLGNLYLTQKNFKKAIHYFEYSSFENNKKALNNLGIMYEFGIGVNDDFDKARYYYELAVKLNYSNALFNLGNLYLTGKAVKQDYITAFNYFISSAKENNSNALFILGYLVYFGEGIKKNDKTAENMFKLAIKFDHLISFFFLGYIYLLNVLKNNNMQDIKKYFDLYLSKKSNNFEILGDIILFDEYLVNNYYNSDAFFENLIQAFDPYYFCYLSKSYLYENEINYNKAIFFKVVVPYFVVNLSILNKLIEYKFE